MSRESHRKFLERNAARKVKREWDRSGHGLSREEAARLSIQTVEPWKRILCLGFGGLVLFFSWKIQQADGNIWAILFVGAIGLALMILGTLGRRKTIDAVLNAAGDNVIQAIFDAF